MMRLFNSILAAIAVVLVVAHAVIGCAILLGWGYFPIVKILARALALVVLVHMTVSIVLTFSSCKKEAKPLAYAKENASLWARRLSGLVIVVTVLLHGGSFGRMVDGAYVLTPWNVDTLAVAWVLAAALTIHLVATVRPLSISLGICIPEAVVRFLQVALLACGVLFLVSFALYAMRWF